MKVVDAYTINPSEIRQGDVMLFIVKAMVVAPGRYRLYRCPYGYEYEGLPQGTRLLNERDVAEAIFPALTWVAEPDS